MSSLRAAQADARRVLTQERKRPWTRQTGTLCRCGQPAVSRGLCKAHYSKQYRIRNDQVLREKRRCRGQERGRAYDLTRNLGTGGGRRVGMSIHSPP